MVSGCGLWKRRSVPPDEPAAREGLYLFLIYLIYNWNYGKPTVKISKFSLPWKQVLSEQSLTNAIKLTDPEHPLLCANT